MFNLLSAKKKIMKKIEYDKQTYVAKLNVIDKMS